MLTFVSFFLTISVSISNNQNLALFIEIKALAVKFLLQLAGSTPHPMFANVVKLDDFAVVLGVVLVVFYVEN